MSKFDVYYDGEDGLPILAKSGVEAGSDRAAVESVCEMFRWNHEGVWAVAAGAEPGFAPSSAADDTREDVRYSADMWDMN